MPVSTDRNPARRRCGLLGTGLILLALWVQAIAPVATLRMVLADPAMPGAILCGHVPANDAIGFVLDGATPAPTCDLCRLCRAGIAPPPVPPVPTLVRPLRWTASTWATPPPCRLKPVPRITGQPRAPPVPA